MKNGDMCDKANIKTKIQYDLRNPARILPPAAQLLGVRCRASGCDKIWEALSGPARPSSCGNMQQA